MPENYYPYVNIANPILNEVISTRFGELQTAYRTSQFNFKPTWGISQLRYFTSSGSGTTLTEANGEFVLSTGTSSSVSASISTIQRGQYQAGTMGQAGIGVRIPVYPTGSQYARWGYFDEFNGFGFGVDSTGSYVFYRNSGSTNYIYQNGLNNNTIQGWNDDKLNGSGSSGLTLNLSDGIISHIEFTWYGYGDVDWVYFPFNSKTGDTVRIPINHLKITGSTSIIDPNQPLTFEVGNGSQTSSSFSLYIGGHQFSVIDGDTTPQKRSVSQLISNFTTAGNTNWQPLIAVRKKLNHGTSNRSNSVRAYVTGYGLAADGELETRLTFNGTTTTGSWQTPTTWTSAESACEVKVTGPYVLAASPEGLGANYGFAAATNQSTGNISRDTLISMGSYQTEIILWVRRLTASGTIIVKNAHLDWEEEW